MSAGPYGAMSTEKEYIIFCDESDRRGVYFSNFYGGVRVGSRALPLVVEVLGKRKVDLGLTSEVKWEKTDLKIVDRYERMVEAFFNEIALGRLFVRIMFTQNARVATGLTTEHHDESYFILYYQFLKHAFGLRHIPPHTPFPRLRVYLDEMGETREKVAKFRGFVGGLRNDRYIRATGLILEEHDITEVRSHDHLLMQCLDVVLGSMSFRLNNKHLLRDPVTGQRGKRTVAKERLYEFILGQIKRVTGKPFFNIGITTGLSRNPEARWADPYLHWLFQPREHKFDGTKTKP